MTEDYTNFISQCKIGSFSKGLHKHHIIPKSEGGKNDKDNLVYLTPAQHFWAHILYDREHGTDTAKRFLSASHINPECYEDCIPYNEIERKRRERVSEVSKGKQWVLGYRHTEETKKKLSEAFKGANNPMYGKPAPEGAGVPPKKVQKFTKDGQFIAEYPSLREAQRQTGVHQSNISACCKGRLKSAGCFLWKFAS